MKRIFYLSILIFLIFWGNNLFSQEKSDVFKTIKKSEPKQGKVEIKQPNEVEQLVLAYISYNSKKAGIEGYRIQVFSETGGSSARQSAENVRTKVLTEFPNEKVSLEYDEPYWKVRVGYFRNRHEAIPFLYKLRPSYPSSHVVKTLNIKPENF